MAGIAMRPIAMHTTTVTKQMLVRGCDQDDLVRRIDDLRAAVRARRGALMDIRWDVLASRAHSAAVIYRLPLGSAAIDLPH